MSAACVKARAERADPPGGHGAGRPVLPAGAAAAPRRCSPGCGPTPTRSTSRPPSAWSTAGTRSWRRASSRRRPTGDRVEKWEPGPSPRRTSAAVGSPALVDCRAGPTPCGSEIACARRLSVGRAATVPASPACTASGSPLRQAAAMSGSRAASFVSGWVARARSASRSLPAGAPQPRRRAGPPIQDSRRGSQTSSTSPSGSTSRPIDRRQRHLVDDLLLLPAGVGGLLRRVAGVVERRREVVAGDRHPADLAAGVAELVGHPVAGARRASAPAPRAVRPGRRAHIASRTHTYTQRHHRDVDDQLAQRRARLLGIDLHSAEGINAGAGPGRCRRSPKYG